MYTIVPHQQMWRELVYLSIDTTVILSMPSDNMEYNVTHICSVKCTVDICTTLQIPIATHHMGDTVCCIHVLVTIGG